MSRLSSLRGRFAGRQPRPENGAAPATAEPAPQPEQPSTQTPSAQRVPVPTRGQLRRERRALVEEREERVRDLGGLMLEMYRRNQFRQDLIFERCTELVSVEGRLREVETLLVAATGPGGLAVYARCACGAALLWGSHFCANCGRAVADAPVVTCARCNTPLAADARFCPACGSIVEGSPAVPSPGLDARDS